MKKQQPINYPEQLTTESEILEKFGEMRLQIALFSDGVFSYVTAVKNEPLVILIKPPDLSRITLYGSHRVFELLSYDTITIMHNYKIIFKK